jgi:hypothetical protein
MMEGWDEVASAKTSRKLRSVLRLFAGRRTPEQPSPRTAHRISYLPPRWLKMPLSCHREARVGYLHESLQGRPRPARLAKFPRRTKKDSDVHDSLGTLHFLSAGWSRQRFCANGSVAS